MPITLLDKGQCKCTVNSQGYIQIVLPYILWYDTYNAFSNLFYINRDKRIYSMLPKSIYRKTIYYRKLGYSYGMISQRLGLAKSTLSNWLKEIPYKPNKTVLRIMGKARMKSAQFQHQQKIASIKKAMILAKKEIGKLNKRGLWLLGVGIYLGEGSKLYETTRLINSDANIIKISMEWFRKICDLKNENFALSIHAYPDTNINKAMRYWSNITKIPKNQFKKTQIDRRENKSGKKKNKLPYGTLHIQINSCGNKKFGRNLHRRIMGWINACYEQI